MEWRVGGITLVAIAAAVLACGCILSYQAYAPSRGNIVKHFEWEFRGKRFCWDLSIPQQLLRHYQVLPRTYDYSRYVTDPKDDEYLEMLSEKLAEADVESGWSGKIDFVLAFVQSLRYEPDNSTGYDEYPRYPLETLAEGGGDCEDTAILFAAILRQMGYGAALLRFDSAHHMAAGVSIRRDVVEKWNREYPLTYFEKEGRLYAYCETTGTGWRIGEEPPWVEGKEAVVIPV